jgi:hypothetical protein
METTMNALDLVDAREYAVIVKQKQVKRNKSFIANLDEKPINKKFKRANKSRRFLKIGTVMQMMEDAT